MVGSAYTEIWTIDIRVISCLGKRYLFIHIIIYFLRVLVNSIILIIFWLKQALHFRLDEWVEGSYILFFTSFLIISRGSCCWSVNEGCVITKDLLEGAEAYLGNYPLFWQYHKNLDLIWWSYDITIKVAMWR